jgi:hypothetical protein
MFTNDGRGKHLTVNTVPIWESLSKTESAGKSDEWSIQGLSKVVVRGRSSYAILVDNCSVGIEPQR